MSFFYKTRTVESPYCTREITELRVGRIITASIALLLLIVILFSSFSIIPSGYTGVRTTFGQIDETVVQKGFTLKVPIVQHIQKVNNKQQEAVFKEKVWGESSERTVVYMEGIVVTYRINPEYSAWIYANVTDYKQNALPQTLVASSMKSAMRMLEAADVTNRSKIEPIAVKNLQSAIDDKYGGEPVIEIVNVNISNMDFEDSYNAAIAAKQVAQMNYEKQLVQNETSIAAANAEAEQKRIAAQANADVRVIAAQADADAILAIARAQADANRELAESITGTLIEYEKVQTWNGVLPTVTGSNAIIGLEFGQSTNGEG